MSDKKKCLMCNKSLVSVGNARENGKYHNDWDKRSLHKKCYKKKIQQILDDEAIKIMIRKAEEDD